jgi:hypothetical protein
MLDEALLAALLIGWAAVLLPSALRSRRESDPLVTVGGFTQAMAVLSRRPDGREIMVPGQAERIVGHGPTGRTAGAPSPRPGRRSELMARRRAMFVRLLGATGVTFLAALVVGGLLWPLFVTTAVALGTYVAMLRHYKLEADQARDVVRTIDLAAAEAAYEDEPWQREPVAVGAEGFPVASRHDEPWAPQSSVRIRRWDA